MLSQSPVTYILCNYVQSMGSVALLPTIVVIATIVLCIEQRL